MDLPSSADLGTAVRFIKQRAEENPFSYSDLFVDTNILSRIPEDTNQVIYGRRGMGKTHLLGTLYEDYQKKFAKKKILPIFIDLRPIHNKASIKEDDQRAYALIAYREFLESIIESIQKFVEDTITVNIFHKIWGGEKQNKLDKVKFLLNDIKNLIQGEPEFDSGTVDSTLEDERGRTGTSEAGLDLGFESTGKNIAKAGAHVSVKRGSRYKTEERMNIIYKGSIVYDKGKIGEDLDKIIGVLALHSVVILLDEWSSIKMECQPFLAEMIKTTIISGRKKRIFVKFSCRRFRTRLSVPKSNRQKIGFDKSELSIDLDLDKHYTSFIEPSISLTYFLLNVLHHHLSAKVSEFKGAKFLDVFLYFIAHLFADDGGIGELVNLSAGIPRDFLNIFSISFLQSEESLPITVQTIRECASDYFWDKGDEEDEEIKELFEDIYNNVKDKSYIFFVSQKYVNDPLLEEIFDNRWIHKIHKGQTAYANGEEGTFNVYKIDAARYISKRATSQGEKSYQIMRLLANTVKKLLPLTSTLDRMWKPEYDDKIVKWFSKKFAGQIEIPQVDVNKLREECSNIVVDEIIQSHQSHS